MVELINAILVRNMVTNYLAYMACLICCARHESHASFWTMLDRADYLAASIKIYVRPGRMRSEGSGNLWFAGQKCFPL